MRVVAKGVRFGLARTHISVPWPRKKEASPQPHLLAHMVFGRHLKRKKRKCFPPYEYSDIVNSAAGQEAASLPRKNIQSSFALSLSLFNLGTKERALNVGISWLFPSLKSVQLLQQFQWFLKYRCDSLPPSPTPFPGSLCRGAELMLSLFRLVPWGGTGAGSGQGKQSASVLLSLHWFCPPPPNLVKHQ